MSNDAVNDQAPRYQVGFSPNYAVAPGDVLEEHRDAMSMTQADLALRLGLSAKHVNRIIAGLEPVTSDTALKLESIFGLPAHVWLNLESRYREFKARESEFDSLSDEAAWLERIPHKSLSKLGWIDRSRDRSELVRSLRGFYRVASLHFLPDVWRALEAQYRKTPAFKSHEWALVAWLAQGERMAERITCMPYDAAALKGSLIELKAFSLLPGADFIEPLTRKCSELGIALVLLPIPDGGRVCGATRWLKADKAVVQLSLRYKTDDQLWFTFFHELGHVLLHKKNVEYIDFEKPGNKSETEKEADEFAAQTLVDQKALKQFASSLSFGAASVSAFAKQQGVAPGIVVGQLQHLGHVPFASTLSKLKKRFVWEHEHKTD
ncbi:MAG TPA: HigA family addiction module antitoxin [Steroidobacteraceae bacterium]|nr:HigA family addiction module antitoxin [Steroidobacteraceae bacterium]